MTVSSAGAAAAKSPDRGRSSSRAADAEPRCGHRRARSGEGRFAERLGRQVEAALRWRRRPEQERDGETPALGGPLAHQRPALPAAAGEPAAARIDGPAQVSAVADRILTGVNRAGEPTARIELNLGDWAGVDVDLVAGARGIQVNVFAATAAARRTIQAQLSSLADALAQRGLRADRIGVSVRRRDNRGGSRQDERR